MKFMRGISLLLGAAALGIGLAGCSQQTVDGVQKDTEHNVAVVNQKVNQAAQEVKPQVKKLAQDVKVQTKKLDLGARVQVAITATEGLKDTDIRVDGDTKGVRLRGTVKTAAQKDLAGRVARDTLDADKTVSNELVVKG